MKLNGKYAIVTGAAQGIGKSIAQRLLEDGVSGVALIDISEEKSKEAAAELDASGERAFGYGCDVSNNEQVKAVFSAIAEKFGKVDILVNNAAITRDGMFHKMSDAQWQTVVNVNLNGVYNCCQAVIGGMRERKYGKIVNLASVSAFGNVGQTNYGATKAAVIGFTKCLARESARNNITVNAIAPSYVDTEMLRAVPDETMQRFLAAIPAGRLADPSEIASVVSFLSCDDSSFVNGECIVVSGGSYM